MLSSAQTTPWFRVGDDPVRPGFYEVLFTWPSGPVIKVFFDGEKWKRIGKMKPNRAWGDSWRGLEEPVA